MDTSEETTGPRQSADEDDDSRNEENVRYGDKDAARTDNEQTHETPGSAREQKSDGGVDDEPHATGQQQAKKNAENEPAT